MSSPYMSVVIPSLEEDQKSLSLMIDRIVSDPSVSEVIVVDDFSSAPLRLQNAKVIRNLSRMGSAKSRAIGVSQATGSIILTTDAHVRFLTPDWSERMCEPILKDRKTVVCPICIPTGDCSFKGKLYGGSVEYLSMAPGIGLAFEPRWNVSRPQDRKVDCVMGGAYAFASEWHRKTNWYSGIKGCCPTELVAVGLKTRLAGGSCVVAEVEMEHEFRASPPFQQNPCQSAYNKIRLASVVFPPEVSGVVPALLRGKEGIMEALKEFVADYKAVVSDRDSFRVACGCTPWEAIERGGIRFGIDFPNVRKIIG